MPSGPNSVPEQGLQAEEEEGVVREGKEYVHTPLLKWVNAIDFAN